MKKILLGLLILPCMALAMGEEQYSRNDYDFALWDAINKHDHPKVLAAVDRSNLNFVWPDYGLTPPMHAVKELRRENRYKMASTVGWDFGMVLSQCAVNQIAEVHPIVKTVGTLVGGSRTTALLLSSQQSENTIGGAKGLLWDLLRHKTTDLEVKSAKNALPDLRKQLKEMTIIEQVASMERSWNPFTVRDGQELRLGLIKLQHRKIEMKAEDDLNLIPLNLPQYGSRSNNSSNGSSSKSSSSSSSADSAKVETHISGVMSEITCAHDILTLDDVQLYRMFGISFGSNKQEHSNIFRQLESESDFWGHVYDTFEEKHHIPEQFYAALSDKLAALSTATSDDAEKAELINAIQKLERFYDGPLKSNMARGKQLVESAHNNN